jgi:dTMP kinase
LSTIDRKRGLFISFEGNEGSGKSTQARLLAARIRRQGYPVVESQEPGGTPIGVQIRRVLLDGANQELQPTTELLLMFAARAQNVDQWIRPALEAGQIVVTDRFTDSTLAFQGAGRGLGRDLVLQVDAIACRGIKPDLTICVTIELERGLERAQNRNAVTQAVETRLDDEDRGFHQRALDEYRRIASDEADRFKLVDGGRPIEVVAEEVWALVEPLLRRTIKRSS